MPGNDARRHLQKSGLLCSSGRRVHDHINRSYEEGKGNCQRTVWEAGPGVRAGGPMAHNIRFPPGLLSRRRKAPSFPSKGMAFLLCVSLFKSIPFTPRCAWVMRTRSVTSQKCHLAVVESSQGGGRRYPSWMFITWSWWKECPLDSSGDTELGHRWASLTWWIHSSIQSI